MALQPRTLTTDQDFNGLQALNPRVHIISTSTERTNIESSALEGQIFYDSRSGENSIYVQVGAQISRILSNKVSSTISALFTYDRSSAPPFAIGSGSAGQMVAGLNSEQLADPSNVGRKGDYSESGNTVAIRESDGTLKVADPVDDVDAVNKRFMESAIAGTSNTKEHVEAATTGNIDISNPGTDTFDGVTLTSGDRLLVWQQTDATENGIYQFNGSGSALTRTSDADEDSEVNVGMFTFCNAGNTYENKGFRLIDADTDPIQLGVTNLTFDLFSGAGQINAGDGLDKSGDTLSVNVDSRASGTATTAIVSDQVRIDANWQGHTALVTVGTITTGAWQGDPVEVSWGGTGATSFTANGVLYGDGTSAIRSTGDGSANTVLVGSGTGNPPVFTNAPTVSSLTTKSSNGVRLDPYGSNAGNTGAVQFAELSANGSNYVGFKAPDAIGANIVWTLPASDGSANHYLKTDGSLGLSFAQIQSSEISNSGFVESVSGTTDRITSSGGLNPTIDIASTYVGQTSITTLGTIATGTWQGDVVALNYGGTGASLADPNDDRVMFWDDSAGSVDWLDMGTGLSISTTTLNVSLSPFDTGDLSEGSNLYYTDERVDDRVNALLQNGGGLTWTYDDANGTLTPDVDHDATTNFVANEHIDHSAVSISPGTGLSGGGDITASRTISLSHLGLESLTDPNADRVFFWDDSAGASAWLAMGTGISISTTTLNVSLSPFDTGDLSEGTNLYYTDTRARNAISGTTDRIDYDSATGQIDIASTYVGQTSITTVGTISTGTWEGSTVQVGFGGTGITSVTNDQIFFGSGGGFGQSSDLTWDDTNKELTVGGNILPDADSTRDIGSPSLKYANIYADNIVGTISPNFTQGSVVFADSNGDLAEDNANFFWDNGNNRLGLRTNSPGDVIDILDDSGGITMRSTDVTTDGGIKSSPLLILQGQYDSDSSGGVTSSSLNASVRHIMEGVAPSSRVAISIGATEVAGFTSDGQIGVGVVDPTNTIEANRASATIGVIDANVTNSLVQLVPGNESYLLLKMPQQNWRVGVDSSERFFVKDGTNDLTSLFINQSAPTGSFYMTANGSIGVKVGDIGANALTFDLEVAGDVGPNADSTYDLGSSSVRWANVYADNLHGTVQSGEVSNSDFVESVSGTADRITSSGGLNPTIDIASTYVGQASITTLGTISTGTWQGNTVGVAYGGTGITSLTDGRVLFAASGVVAQDSGLFWDNTNKRFGIGIQSPLTTFEVNDGTSRLRFAEDNTLFGNPSGSTLMRIEANTTGKWAGVWFREDTIDWFGGVDDNGNFVLNREGTEHLTVSVNQFGFRQTNPKETIHLGIGTIRLDSFTSGSVPYIDSNGNLTENNSNLFWDNANKRLGIGTSPPSSPLHVRDNGDFIRYEFPSTSSFGGIKIFEGASNIATIQGIGSDFSTSSRQQALEIESNGGAVTIQRAGGNVGIGIDNAQDTFHLGSGSARIDSLTADRVAITDANKSLATSPTTASQLAIAPRAIGGREPRNGLHWNGTEGGQIEIGSDAAFDDIFDGGGTIRFQAKKSGNGSTDFGRLIDKEQNGGFGIWWEDNEDKIELRHEFDTSDGIWELTPTLTRHEVYDVVIQYDKSSDQNVPRCWVNSVEQSVVTSSSPSGTARSDSGSDLAIGARINGGAAFNGSILYVSFLNYTATAPDVTEAYETGEWPFRLSSGSNINQLSDPNDFDQSTTAWNNDSVNVTTDTQDTTDPDGGNKADTITEDGTASTNHRIQQTVSGYNGPETYHRLVVSAKPNGRNWIALRPGSFSVEMAWFDIQSGAVGTEKQDVVRTSIKSQGNGWYRCEVVARLNRGEDGVDASEIFLADGDGSTVYDGDDTSGVFLYDAVSEPVGVTFEADVEHADPEISPLVRDLSGNGNDGTYNQTSGISRIRDTPQLLCDDIVMRGVSSLRSTPDPGALEYDGSRFYITPTSGNRYRVAQTAVYLLDSAEADVTVDGSGTEFTVTHDMGTREVGVEVFEADNTGNTVDADVRRPTVDTVLIGISSGGGAVAEGTYKVIITA